MFTGDFYPDTISIVLMNADTGEQFDRDVSRPPKDPSGNPMRVHMGRSPEYEIAGPGTFQIKFDADGISPAYYQFQLLDLEAKT